MTAPVLAARRGARRAAPPARRPQRDRSPLVRTMERLGAMPERARRRGTRHSSTRSSAAGSAGGAGARFPTAQKLRAVRDGRGPQVVVVNGAEGEPASAKDALLLRDRPHLVLDGAVLAADAVHAREVIVAVDRASLGRPARARAGPRRAPPRPCRRRVAAGGRGAEPVRRRRGEGARPPDQRGRGEADVRRRARTNGGYAVVPRSCRTSRRSRTSRSSPGSEPSGSASSAPAPDPGPRSSRSAARWRAQASTRSSWARPSLLSSQLPAAPPRRSRRSSPAGTTARGSPRRMRGTSHSGPTSSPASAAPSGAGSCTRFPRPRAAWPRPRASLRYLAEETAGQCGPCVHGLASIADALDAVAAGESVEYHADRVQRWSGQIAGRGACRLPDGASALRRDRVRRLRARVGTPRPQGCLSSVAESWQPAAPVARSSANGGGDEAGAAARPDPLRRAGRVRRAVPGMDHLRRLGVPDRPAGRDPRARCWAMPGGR